MIATWAILQKFILVHEGTLCPTLLPNIIGIISSPSHEDLNAFIASKKALDSSPAWPMTNSLEIDAASHGKILFLCNDSHLCLQVFQVYMPILYKYVIRTIMGVSIPQIVLF